MFKKRKFLIDKFDIIITKKTIRFFKAYFRFITYIEFIKRKKMFNTHKFKRL